MTFTVDDFPSLIRLLGEHPEWRAELRRHVLSEELLELPTIVRQVADQLATLTARVDALADQLGTLTARVDALAVQLGTLTARVDALAEAQARTEERLTRLEEVVERLAEAQARTEERLTRLEEVVARLAEAQARTEAELEKLIGRVDGLARDVRRLQADVGALKGDSLEQRYRRHASGYFGRLLRKTRVVADEEWRDLLEDAVERGQLSEEEAGDLGLVDLALQGVWRADGEPVHVLVEVSAKVDVDDVARAARRAALLTRVAGRTLPAVAGTEFSGGALDEAARRQVLRFSDGASV